MKLIDYFLRNNTAIVVLLLVFLVISMTTMPRMLSGSDTKMLEQKEFKYYYEILAITGSSNHHVLINSDGIIDEISINGAKIDADVKRIVGSYVYVTDKPDKYPSGPGNVWIKKECIECK